MAGEPDPGGMGLMDKLKTAVNTVSGGSARVSIEYPPHSVYPGESVPVRVTVMSGGGEVKSNGIFVDLLAVETVTGSDKVTCPRCRNQWSDPINKRNEVVKQSIPLAPAFVLNGNETRVFEGQIQVPGGSPPSYTGTAARFEWTIRGRLEAFGNDPDSGYQSLRVGAK